METPKLLTAVDGTKLPINFLVVDDDKVSVMAIKRGFKLLAINNPIHVAHDGYQALEKLRGTGGNEKLEPPFIVTLDINMPRMNGLEFLEEIRKDDELKDTIVFVLSTSDAPTDIKSAYNKNVAGYIQKDSVTESLKSALEMIGDYAKIVKIPA